MDLTEPIDPMDLKTRWLEALEQAEEFVRSRPAEEIGCLYYAPEQQRFGDPSREADIEFVIHFGRPGGVLPHTL